MRSVLRGLRSGCCLGCALYVLIAAIAAILYWLGILWKN